MEKHELAVPLKAAECKQKYLSVLVSCVLMCSIVRFFFSAD